MQDFLQGNGGLLSITMCIKFSHDSGNIGTSIVLGPCGFAVPLSPRYDKVDTVSVLNMIPEKGLQHRAWYEARRG